MKARSTSTDDYLFKHVFELEFDGYLITSNLQMSSTNVTILEVARPAGVHFTDIVFMLGLLCSCPYFDVQL